MKVPYGEGVAIHTGPESCGGGSNVMAEALTGVRIGQVLSREMLVNSRVPTPCVMRKAIPNVSLSLETFGLCAVGDLGIYGNMMHGNREIPYSSPYSWSGYVKHWRYDLRQEPYEVVPHVRICAGGVG